MWFHIEKQMFSGCTILHFFAPCELDRFTLKPNWMHRLNLDAPFRILRYLCFYIRKQMLSGCTILHLECNSGEGKYRVKSNQIMIWFRFQLRIKPRKGHNYGFRDKYGTDRTLLASSFHLCHWLSPRPRFQSQKWIYKNSSNPNQIKSWKKVVKSNHEI